MKHKAIRIQNTDFKHIVTELSKCILKVNRFDNTCPVGIAVGLTWGQCTRKVVHLVTTRVMCLIPLWNISLCNCKYHLTGWHFFCISITSVSCLYRRWQQSTMRCHYNMVTFLTNIHIPRPHRRGMRCLLWTQHLIDILPQFLIIYVISFNIGPRYNGTLKYLESTLSNFNWIELNENCSVV